MGARLRSWWQRVRKPLEIFFVIVGCILVIALLVVIALAYIFNVNVPGLRGKTLWDWLQLLFVPVVLAVAGFWFNHRERQAAELRTENERKAAGLRAEAEREIEQQRAEADHEISLDNQREAALKEYIDKMSELLLHENLRKSEPEDEVRKIARVRTLTVLPRLDGERKGSVLQFLHESGLIEKDNAIVDIKGADLHGAFLFGANLKGAYLKKAILEEANLRVAQLYDADLFLAKLNKADLSYAFMSGANLMAAKLKEANLRGARMDNTDLSEADLSGAYLGGTRLDNANLQGAKIVEEQLKEAKSLEGATMPDGSKHP